MAIKNPIAPKNRPPNQFKANGININTAIDSNVF
jgi:hypothetical protein